MLNLNLLPPEAKIELAYALRTRAVLAAAGALAIALAIGGLALLPTILRLRATVARARAEFARQQEVLPAVQGLVLPGEVRAANQLAAAVLRNEAERTPVSPWLLAVLRAAPAGVRLEAVDLRIGPKNLAIQGFALRRSDLLAYLRALRGQPGVASVTTPVSSLLREADVKFSLAVTLK